MPHPLASIEREVFHCPFADGWCYPRIYLPHPNQLPPQNEERSVHWMDFQVSWSVINNGQSEWKIKFMNNAHLLPELLSSLLSSPPKKNSHVPEVQWNGMLQNLEFLAVVDDDFQDTHLRSLFQFDCDSYLAIIFFDTLWVHPWRRIDEEGGNRLHPVNSFRLLLNEAPSSHAQTS